MATTKQTRIRLSDLASVEIGKATLDDAPDKARPTEAPRSRTLQDSPELGALPDGVSPEVAKLLDLPEHGHVPEPESAPAPAPIADATPAQVPPRSPLGVIAAGLVVAVGVTVLSAYFLVQPPPMDPRTFDAVTLAPETHPIAESLVEFVPLPVVEVAPEPEPAAAPERRQRRVPAPPPVRRTDLL